MDTADSRWGRGDGGGEKAGQKKPSEGEERKGIHFGRVIKSLSSYF